MLPPATDTVGGSAYHAAMPTTLSLNDHLSGLSASGAAFRKAAETAGLHAKVATCPAWDITKLVTHQGKVHQWAAANLRGEPDHDPSASVSPAQGSSDLLGWFSDGLESLIDTLRAAPDDVVAKVFLNDAPPPRQFWARRQCHETTIHSVDALSAVLGRWPAASDTAIDSQLAADGIDELLTGFITRGKGALHADEPYTILVRTDDTGHAWSVRISDGPIVTTTGESGQPDAVFSGSAVQLYLSLWNRADEITADGRQDALSQWRSNITI
jgi:uncharacterized protein (TIGR03083 family)